MQISAQLRSLKNAFSLLRDRSIVRVEGRDAFKFLQGLTTNDLSLLQRRPLTSIYTNVLNAQGRVAFDLLISPPPDSPTSTTTTTPEQHTYLLDCAKNAVEDIQKHFDKYLLRNKVKITDISNTYKVWSVFGNAVSHSPLPHAKFGSSSQEVGMPMQSQVTGSLADWWDTKKDGVLVMDPRFEKLGARIILPASETPKLPETFTEVNDSVYNLYRLQWGIPQGPNEIHKDVLLPLEGNAELLNGVHLHKGCYVGQELVARTHYSGLVRKRLFPFVMLSNTQTPKPEDLECGDKLFPPIVDNLAIEIPPTGATLNVGDPSVLQGSVSAQRDRKAGKVVTGVHNVGIAMVRLESLNNLSATSVKDENGRSATLLTPCWWDKEVENIKKMQKSL